MPARSASTTWLCSAAVRPSCSPLAPAGPASATAGSSAAGASAAFGLPTVRTGPLTGSSAAGASAAFGFPTVRTGPLTGSSAAGASPAFGSPAVRTGPLTGSPETGAPSAATLTSSSGATPSWPFPSAAVPGPPSRTASRWSSPRGSLFLVTSSTSCSLSFCTWCPPSETGESALDPVAVLLGGPGGELPLTLDGQQAVLERDLEVLGVDPGHLDGDQVGVLALGDVERRDPHPGAGLAALPARRLAQGPTEELVHLVLDRKQVLERVPTRQHIGHDCLPFLLGAIPAPTSDLARPFRARSLTSTSSVERLQVRLPSAPGRPRR